ncbi:MAG: hypothetical protein KDA45_08500, partial [Planctomycetales bacterium]|nr:hypothetical protein [Planctomycetales bacterium]
MVSTSHKAASFNLPRSRLRLRQDVRCTPLVQRGETFYQLEVPGTGQFYRLGYAESVFVSLLDGQTTFTTALALTTQHLAEQQLTTQPPSPPPAPVNTVSVVDPVGAMDAENSVTVSLPPSPAAAAPLQTLTTSQATSLYLWLLENGLGTLVDAGPESGELTPRRSAGARTGGRSAVACPNPFWLKLPLGNPDRLLGYLLPATSWIFSPFFTMVGLLVIAAGAVTLSLHWERFLAASTQVFSPHNWLWLAAAWLLLKVIHELAHALVCRRYGGEVRDVGLILILFAPLAYVDVSSAWRFPSKWSRIHVAVAGIYAELLLAALAAVAWQQVESPMVGHLLYNLILMASVSTVVFNANPLMRFDGYFMLSDWLEIPNLYAAGSKAVARQCRRLFLGERSGELRYGGKLAWWIGAYGWAALGWRIAVCGSLLLAASLLFHGAGIALSALALLAWVGRPLWAGWTGCLRRWQRQPGQVLRAAGLSILLGWLGCLFLFYLPSPARVSAPGIV